MKGIAEISEGAFDSLIPDDPFEVEADEGVETEEAADKDDEQEDGADTDVSAADTDVSADEESATDAEANKDNPAKPKVQGEKLDVAAHKGRLVTIKEMGKDVEVTLEEALSRASKADGADARFQEAAIKEQRLVAFREQLKTDPMTVLSREDMLGKDGLKKLVKEWFGKQIKEELEWDSLDPKDKEIRKLRAEIEQTRAQKKEVAEKEWKDWLTANKEHFSSALQTAFSQPDVKIPLNMKTGKLAAEAIDDALQKDAKLEAELRQNPKEASLKILAAALPVLQAEYIKQVGELMGTDDEVEILAAINRQKQQQKAADAQTATAATEESATVPGVKASKGRKRTRTAKIRAESGDARMRELISGAIY